MSEKYRVCFISTFSAAHFLRHYEGKCKRLHGHNYKVEVYLVSEKLENGMVADFNELKNIVEETLEEFDHFSLNDLPYFKEEETTAENIARVIYDLLKPKIPMLEKVRVWEDDTSWAEVLVS